VRRPVAAGAQRRIDSFTVPARGRWPRRSEDRDREDFRPRSGFARRT